ncbi:hypothetical protein F53441_2595 [Fusarium austroafricanum]|uniref:Uncharacterized protein n=1 Tax=Fusarium austroafricanum TaxID=2364996 RepID=A0A8H4P2P7_9HYPO|nr:hypothetical protein F53441_2595 [Fusarium austroafricanum]
MSFMYYTDEQEYQDGVGPLTRHYIDLQRQLLGGDIPIHRNDNNLHTSNNVPIMDNNAGEDHLPPGQIGCSTPQRIASESMKDAPRWPSIANITPMFASLIVIFMVTSGIIQESLAIWSAIEAGTVGRAWIW